jgi:hypothetical protein
MLPAGWPGAWWRAHRRFTSFQRQRDFVVRASKTSPQTVNEINIVQIYAVPAGAALDVKEGRVTIEGDPVTELPTVETYTGTPGLPATVPDTAVHNAAEPLPVTEVSTDNVTRLDTFKRDRED